MAKMRAIITVDFESALSKGECERRILGDTQGLLEWAQDIVENFGVELMGAEVELRDLTAPIGQLDTGLDAT